MKDATILKTGVVGSVIAAVCCATPVLAITFGAFGVSAWLAWADYVLIPMLIMFVGLTAYGVRRRWQTATCRTTETDLDRRNA